MSHTDKVTRRDFIKLSETAAGALAFPWKGLAEFFKIKPLHLKHYVLKFLRK